MAVIAEIMLINLQLVTNVSISVYGQKYAHVLLLSPATITQSSGQ